MCPGVNKLTTEKYKRGAAASLLYVFTNIFVCFTWTLARTTSMGLVIVEAVAAAIGPAKACRIRWGHSLGANRDSCSVMVERGI